MLLLTRWPLSYHAVAAQGMMKMEMSKETSFKVADIIEQPVLKHEEEKVPLHKLVMAFTAQIAGHGSEGDGHRKFLKHTNGRLLKPLQDPPKGTREANFYKTVSESNDPADVEIRECIPQFFGVEEIKETKGLVTSDAYLILEDITEGFEVANVMDIKIGSRTWGPDATLEKQKQEDAKYKGTKMPLGFSVLGIIVNSINGLEQVKYDKNFGKHLRTEDVLQVPEIFFDVNNTGVVPDLAEIVIDKLLKLLSVFERQRKYLIYASSALLAYDAAAVRRFLETRNRDILERGVQVKLIDFAHVFPAKGKVDDNFLRGLRNLIKVFEKFISECDSKMT